MATIEGPVKFANQILGVTPFGHQNLARLVRGCELLMEGLMNVAIQHIEVTQTLIAGEVADLELLTRVATPAALVEAQLEVMRRRSERVITATRKITDEITRSWAETHALVQSYIDTKSNR
jgi:hypothetical protein